MLKDTSREAGWHLCPASPYASIARRLPPALLWQPGDEAGVAGGDALQHERLGYLGDELQSERRP